MSLNIKDAKTDKLAREVAELAGESITEAIRRALEERRERLILGRKRKSLAEELEEIGSRCAALPDLDKRSTGEILAYDKKGLWRSWSRRIGGARTAPQGAGAKRHG